MFRFLIPSALVLAFSATSHATVLDFEGLSGTNFGTYTDYGTHLTTNGYVVSGDVDPTGGGLVSWNSGAGSNGYANYTGSTALFERYLGNLRVTIAKADGGSFDLLGMDVANLNSQSSGTAVTNLTFKGTRLDGTFLTQPYTTTPDDALHPVAFVGFTNLVSFTFENSDPYYCQFDNVTINAVPEPATFLVLGLSALGLIGHRRRS